MKTIAFYLPQFHTIPENDEWWGKDFTEWVNVKKATPLYDGHNQPRVPLDNNYYDLSNTNIMKWQIELAKRYGLYGFCFYHYWFDGHLLLQKPIENYLKDKECDFPFCLCWANEHWTNAWATTKDSILIEQRYGDEKEWTEHFRYLLPFLTDERYIKMDEKPLVVIYKPNLISCVNEMLDCWNNLAIANGLKGLTFAYQHLDFDIQKNKDDSRFEYNIEYQPAYAQYDITKNVHPVLKKIKRYITPVFDKFKINITQIREPGLLIRDYDEVWKAVLEHRPVNEKCIPGAFVDWDNTPRRNTRGSVFKGASPEKFKKYMTIQIRRAKEVYHKDYIFIFAWNEWAEGGYLEPDEKFKYGYLEALKEALEVNKEL